MFSTEDIARSVASNIDSSQGLSDPAIKAFIEANLSDPQKIAQAAAQFGVTASDIERATGYSPTQQASFFEQAKVTPTYGGLTALDRQTTTQAQANQGALSQVAPALNQDLLKVIGKPDVSDIDIYRAMQQYQTTPEQLSTALGTPLTDIQSRYAAAQQASQKDFEGMVDRAYESIGAGPNAPGREEFVQDLVTGRVKPEDFQRHFLNIATQVTDPKYSENVAIAKSQLRALNTPKTVTSGGRTYDTETLLRLASQIVPNLGELKGGIFGTKGESVGFDYNTARQVFGGQDVGPGEQVVLDMARELMNRGITDLNQLQVKDILGTADVREERDESGASTGKFYALIPTGDETYEKRYLSPEDIARMQTLQEDFGEGSYTRQIIPDYAIGRGLYSPTELLAAPYGDAREIRFELGKTYSGPGMTGYNMMVNPTTGKLQFTTYGQDTGQGQLISAALTMASFVPGLNVFAQAANAIWAMSQGNYLAGLANMAGMGGFTNAATALNVANAIQNNNPLGVVTALVNNPTISNSVSSINIAGNITLSDISRTANLVAAADRGDWAGVAQIGGQLINSTDLQTAAAAARVVEAVSSGNFTAALNATKGLERTLNAANNVTNPNVATNIAEVVNRDVTGDAATARDTIINAAMSNGASLQDAIDAAEAIVQVQDAVTLVSDEGADLTETLKNELDKTLEKIDLGEFAGFDDAAARTIERNTLNISNTEADTPEEAAALAGARGYTAFNFGGETYQMSVKAADVAQQAAEQDIASQDTFANAYQAARNQLGPGQIFTWNGKQYSTDTREENPSLAAASDQIRAAQMGVANGKGTYAGYDESAVDNALSQLGTFDSFLNATTEDGQKIVVGDQISKDLITPFVRIFGLTTRAGGELAESLAGSLAAMNVIDKDSAFLRAATEIKNSSKHAIGNDIAQAEKNVFDRVSKADGALEKGKELFKAMWDNPITIFTLPFNEGVQEIVPLLSGVGAAKWIGKIAGLTTSAGMNAAEAAGANYNETVAMAQRAGMSAEDAHAAGQKSALAAGTVAAVLGPVAELPFIKRAAGDAVGDAIGSTVKRSVTAAGREAVTEYPEEAIASIAADYFATGTFDPNKALTQATIASVTAGKTVGAFTAATDVLADRSATDQIISSNAFTDTQRPVVDQVITTTLQSNQNLVDVGNQISTNLVQSGISEDQANNIANTVVAEQFINNINTAQPEGSAFAINDLNQAVGVDARGNAVTVGDVIGSSITNRGNETYLAPDIVIGTNAQGGVLTIGDLSTIQGATTTEAANDATTSETVREGDVATTTSTDQNTGATTTTETNTQTNVTTETTIAAETQTTTVTDPNANTATRTEVNLETNTQITTTNDVNTNTVTQTTVDTNTNTTTEVAINNDTNVTTQTTTDNNTNTQTTVQTNPVDNVQITTVVDGNTGEVIEETITEVPSDWSPPVIDAPAVNQPTTTTPTKTQTKQTPRRVPPALGGLPLAAEVISDDDLTFKDPFISSRMKQEAFKGSLDPFLTKVESDQALDRQYEPIRQAQAQEEAAMNNYFTYGVPVDINEVFSPVPRSFREMIPAGEEGSLMAAAKGGLATPLMARGGLSSYAGGGLPVVAHSGKARVDFRQGAAVSGPGDGQSDDIPAMLADGEFVFPADVVAALGNGSTKAGSDKLYEMMHSIRAHHRSAKPKDLPPPAKKSPLDYLKKVRR